MLYNITPNHGKKSIVFLYTFKCCVICAISHFRMKLNLNKKNNILRSKFKKYRMYFATVSFWGVVNPTLNFNVMVNVGNH